jgi:hypothetical protein
MADEPKTAKIPEGVTVETPKQNELRTLPIPDFTLDPSLPIISNPHFTNNKKSEMSCMLLRPNGQCTVEAGIPTDEKHPLFRDIKRQFSEDEINQNTRRQVQIQIAMAAADKIEKENQEREARRANLWSIKSTFLDLPSVKGTEHKTLKRKLRSATSPEEAQAFGIAIVIKEAEKDAN